MNNFSFCYNVFKSPLMKRNHKVYVCRKGLIALHSFLKTFLFKLHFYWLFKTADLLLPFHYCFRNVIILWDLFLNKSDAFNLSWVRYCVYINTFPPNRRFLMHLLQIAFWKHRLKDKKMKMLKTSNYSFCHN